MAKGTYTIGIGKNQQIWTWITHIIITKNGIAYKDHNNIEFFDYWTNISRKYYRHKMKLSGEVFTFDLHLKNLSSMSDETYNVLRGNFSPFIENQTAYIMPAV